MGFRFHFYLNHESYGRGGITFETDNIAEWEQAMDEVAAFAGKMKAKGWLPDSIAQPVVVKTPTGQKPPEQRRRLPEDFDYTQPVPAEMLPESLDSRFEYYIEAFDYIDIEPKRDNRVTIKFFANHLQFPVGLMNNWDVDKAAEHISAIGMYNFGTPDRIRVTGYIYWTYGKEYEKKDKTKGRYRDVAYVTKQI